MNPSSERDKNVEQTEIRTEPGVFQCRCGHLALSNLLDVLVQPMAKSPGTFFILPTVLHFKFIHSANVD